MSYKELAGRVDGLSRIAGQLCPGDWVSLHYTSNGHWAAQAFFSNIRVADTNPFDALKALEAELYRRLATDSNLARTLGIEAA